VTPPPPGRIGRSRPPVRYLMLVAAVLCGFLLFFLLAQAFAVRLLEDPGPWLTVGGPAAAGLGIGLLVADVVLPVPSSLVMVAHGAVFGVALGAGLSLLGAVGAAMSGYGLGRWAGPPLLRRVCSPAERDRAADLLRRWGLLAVVASRPVPLLAETVALVAGAERLGVRRTAAASIIGALPGALLYAAAGTVGTAGPGGAAVFGTVVAIAALLWLSGTGRARRSTGPASLERPRAL
jgi:uncharacterized membrane protein YdjX (TVP38/TMEM64 family)